MRGRFLLVLASVAALALTSPARADFVGVCNPDPYFCIGLDQWEEDDFSGTFVIVQTDAVEAFAGSESEPSSGYAGTGACGFTTEAGGCVVVFQDYDDVYLTIGSSEGCATIPLTGGENDYC